MKRISFLVLFLLVIGLGAGCKFPSSPPNVMVVPTPLNEPDWVRNGLPIQFENENWFPTDEVENLMDNELYQAGEYHDVAFFIDRSDVKPFDRLYTRFAKNRYRAFEKKD